MENIRKETIAIDYSRPRDPNDLLIYCWSINEKISEFTTNYERAKGMAIQISVEKSNLAKLADNVRRSDINPTLRVFLKRNMKKESRRMIRMSLQEKRAFKYEWRNLLRSLDNKEKIAYLYTIVISGNELKNLLDYKLEKESNGYLDDEMLKKIKGEGFKGIIGANGDGIIFVGNEEVNILKKEKIEVKCKK